MTDLARCIPVLASLNIDESYAYYTERLGFAGERIDDYLIVKRDDMEIHFWLAKDRSIAESTSCYIRGGQIDELYADFTARAVPGLTDYAVRPWNMKEFYIRDPHGNLLRFGRIPGEE